MRFSGSVAPLLAVPPRRDDHRGASGLDRRGQSLLVVLPVRDHRLGRVVGQEGLGLGDVRWSTPVELAQS
jgi:hypothetical protein